MKQRWPWVALAVVAVIWLAPNLFLWSHWLDDNIGTHAPGVKLSLDGAWAPLPWIVRADQARFVVDEDAVDFEVVLHDVSLDVSLLGLLNRTLSLDGVEAQGGSASLRSASPGGARRQAALPEIAGVALKPPTHAPSTIDKDKAWLIEISGIDLRLSELWVDAIRLRGATKVHGAFRYRALTMLQIDKARVDLHGATLSVGDKAPFAHGLAAEVHGSTPRIDVSDDAWGLVDQLRATVRARADLVGSEWLGVYFPDQPLTLASAGHAVLALQVEKGAVQAPSWAHVSFPDAQLRRGDIRAKADVQLALLVDDARATPRLLVEAPELSVTKPRKLEANGVRAWAPVNRRLRELGAIHDVHAAVRHVESSDLERLTLTPSLGVHGGTLLASGSYDQWHERRAVHLNAKLRRVSLTYDTYGLYTDAQVEGSVRLTGDRMTVARGRLELDRARLRIGEDTVENWGGRLSVKTSRSGKGCTRGTVETSATSAEPIHAFAGGGLLEKALAPDGAVKLDGDLTTSSKGWSVRIRRGQVGATPVRGIVAHRDTTAAAFFIDGPVISIGVRVDDGGVHLKPFVGAVPDGVAPVVCGA